MPAASVTVAAAITGRTVPSVAFVLLSVIVYGPVPEPVTEPTVQPVLVPPTVTADAVMPVTLFENDTEKTAEVPDSEVSVKDEAVGTTVSFVTIVAAVAAAVALAFSLLNLAVLEPLTTAAMYHRRAAQAEGSKFPENEKKKANGRFGMLHGLSSLANLFALGAGVTVLWFSAEGMLVGGK